MHLKTLNQRILEQIKDLKDEKLKYKINELKNQELIRLKKHNQSLLSQIKKLKDDKKSLKNKLEEFLTKEVSKLSDVTHQVEDKETNTNLVNITTQEEEKPIEVKTNSDVAVQTMEIPSDDSVTNSTTTVPEVNHKITTNILGQDQTTRAPYRHLNHKSRQLS